MNQKPTLPRSTTPGGPTRPSPGAVKKTFSVTKRTKDGGQKTLHDEASVEERPASGDETAQAGVAIGYSIPGPPGSYASARIDAFVSLPCRPEPEAVKEKMAIATHYAEEQIGEMSQAVQEFFANWR